MPNTARIYVLGGAHAITVTNHHDGPGDNKKESGARDRHLNGLVDPRNVYRTRSIAGLSVYGTKSLGSP
jgi:hypothetical protein